jgi:hypothetical protein
MEEVIPLQEHALRLSPHDPLISNMYGRIAAAFLFQSRVDEATIWGAVRPFPHTLLAAAYGLKGEIERAAAELTEAQRLRGDGILSSFARLKSVYFKGDRNIGAMVEATYITSPACASRRSDNETSHDGRGSYLKAALYGAIAGSGCRRRSG